LIYYNNTTTIYIIADSQVKTNVLLSLHAAYSLVVKNAGSRTIPGVDSYMYQADKANLGAESYNVMCAPICIPLALFVLPLYTTEPDGPILRERTPTQTPSGLTIDGEA
jgi:hypothetical protein